jgi:hypothetical protein
MQWVMARVLPPRGMLHLQKRTDLTVMAAAQALLWHRGHFELAALLTAIEQSGDDSMQYGGTDSRARISKEQMEILDRLYPFVRKPSGKQRVTKRTNPAAEAIESMSELFSEHDWRLTLPQEWVAQVTGNKNQRRYAVPHDIKIKLANLAIALAQRSF